MKTELLPAGWKTAAFLAAFVPIWIACDIAGELASGGTGFGAWYLNAAFDVTLYLVLGWRWWPLPVLLYTASIVIYPDRPGSPALNVLADIPYELIYALAVKAALDLRVRFPLAGMRDVVVFAVILGGLAPLLSNAAIEAVFVAARASQLGQFMTDLVRGAGADATAVIVLVPAITQLMAWRKPHVPEGSDRGVRIDRPFLLGLVVTAAVVVAEYTIGAKLGRTFVEFSFLPLAWLAVSYDLRGAVLGIVVADICATLMHLVLSIPIDSQIEYQGYLVASALMALFLGAVATNQQRLLGQLERGAYVDPLTDLPNTNRLLEWIRSTRGRPVVLAIVDIADLRLLNEGVGRRPVDRLLLEFAARLRSSFDAGYLVARVGSSEFAVAFAGDREPRTLIEAVAALIAEPFQMDGADVFVDVSIGATRAGPDEDAQELMRRVDLAVRRAKSEPNRTAVVERTVEEDAPTLLVVELHRAAEQGEFVPFFQPIYRYHRGTWELCGAEMLMRWRHPRRGLLAPADFIDLLERLSICNRVGWSLLEESLHLTMRWRASVSNFTMWVNLFPRQILDARCAERIRGAVEAAGAVPQALVVEITERVVAADDVAFANLAERLRAFGAIVAIDDFGTGGSSLARLRQIPAQILKIDRSFVNRSDVDVKAASVASAVVRLAAELDMGVVAEGIENALQAQAMIDAGCAYGQGYAFGHPSPAPAFERFLTASPLLSS